MTEIDVDEATPGKNSEGAELLSLEPVVTPKELQILRKWYSGAEFVVEFGAGGSTVLAGALGVPRVASVDSSKAWLEKLRTAPELQNTDFTAHHVNIGKLKAWGHPADFSRTWNWPSYYRVIWDQIDNRRPDVVFVDGRFRVACALMTLLECPAETTVIIHDFWNRPSYGEILKYVDTIERDDDIGVFRRKIDVNWRGLALSLSHFALDPT